MSKWGRRRRRVVYPGASLASHARHPLGADTGHRPINNTEIVQSHPLPQPARMLRDLGLTDAALSELFGIEFDTAERGEG